MHKINTLQPTFIGMKELRANLKHTLDDQQPRIVGTRFSPRALIIPIPSFNPWLRGAQRRTHAHFIRCAHAASKLLSFH